MLGCTHCSLIASLIQKIAGSGVAGIELSSAVARQVVRWINGVSVSENEPRLLSAYTNGNLLVMNFF